MGVPQLLERWPPWLSGICLAPSLAHMRHPESYCSINALNHFFCVVRDFTISNILVVLELSLAVYRGCWARQTPDGFARPVLLYAGSVTGSVVEEDSLERREEPDSFLGWPGAFPSFTCASCTLFGPWKANIALSVCLHLCL